MNVHARARASAQAIDRSATRLDPVVGLDDLLRRHRRQPLRRAAAAAGFALLVAAVAIWAGVVLRGPTPIQPTLGPVTRIRVGPSPVSVAVTPDAAWVLNSGDSTISRVDPGTGRVQSSFLVSGPSGCAAVWRSRRSRKDDCGWSTRRAWDSSAISVIDPSTGRVLTTFGFGGIALSSLGTPGNLAIGAGAVWVAVQGEDEVQRVRRRHRQAARPVPAARADRAGRGRPDGVGAPASMDGCAASISTPVRFGCVPPPSW